MKTVKLRGKARHIVVVETEGSFAAYVLHCGHIIGKCQEPDVSFTKEPTCKQCIRFEANERRKRECENTCG